MILGLVVAETTTKVVADIHLFVGGWGVDHGTWLWSELWRRRLWQQCVLVATGLVTVDARRWFAMAMA